MFAILLLLVLGAPPAGAQTVYKCTTDDKVSYGSAPCADGAGVTLDVPAAPAPERPPPAPAKGQAERLAREGRQREAMDARARQRLERAAAARRKACAELRLRRRWADEDAALASDKRAAKARQQARRAADKLALACPA